MKSLQMSRPITEIDAQFNKLERINKYIFKIKVAAIIILGLLWIAVALVWMEVLTK